MIIGNEDLSGIYLNFVGNEELHKTKNLYGSIMTLYEETNTTLFLHAHSYNIDSNFSNMYLNVFLPRVNFEE